jgi:FMN phosphatase YigB (HAD superfamily)
METKPVLNDIKAVSFDLDDTLWHTAPVIQNAQAKIKQHLLDQFPRFNPKLWMRNSGNHWSWSGKTIRRSSQPDGVEEAFFRSAFGKLWI